MATRTILAALALALASSGWAAVGPISEMKVAPKPGTTFVVDCINCAGAAATNGTSVYTPSGYWLPVTCDNCSSAAGNGTTIYAASGYNLPVAVQHVAFSLTVHGNVVATQSGVWTVSASGGPPYLVECTNCSGAAATNGTTIYAASGYSLPVELTAVPFSLTIQGDVVASQGGTWTVGVDSLPALAAGTNNIGNVDVASLPALAAGTANIGDVDVLTLPALPAGTNNIGTVGLSNIPFSQTIHGTVIVGTLPALAAGTNAIGTVGINAVAFSQTVHGTVTVGAALPAGANNIGDVDVASLPALPAGTNSIGTVVITQTETGVGVMRALPAGTNAIGKLAANTGVDIGDVDVTSVSAGTNRVGGTYDVGGTIIDEAPAARAVSRAFANGTASGNTAVVAAQGAGVKIRVLAVVAVTSAASTLHMQSATTAISASLPCAANGGFVLPYNPHGWFQTAANEALNGNSSATANVGWQVIWCPAQ